MRWVAQYPGSTTFAQAERSKPDATEGTVGAWQFTSGGRIDGYAGNLDCNLFYGDAAAWAAYVRGDNVSAKHDAIVVENDEYKVTMEEKG